MIELPPSKSIGARYMVATYFAGTLPADPYFEDNEDLMVLQQALLEVYSDEEPIDYGDSPIDVGASGTALRFVTAVCASSPGADYVVTGTPRLMERPMDPLINLLKEAGAGIETLGEKGTGPYRVKGGKLKGGELSIRGDLSSQFISALMLVAPSWEKGMRLKFTTTLVSRPYIEMTSRLMKKFGIKTKLTDEMVEVPNDPYIEPLDFHVEADWSSASFFYEASAISGKKLQLKDLIPPSDSLQGDSVTDSLFSLLGVKSKFDKEGVTIGMRDDASGMRDEGLGMRDEELGMRDEELEMSDGELGRIEYSFKDCPDLLLPFAVAALCNGVHFHFGDVAHLRLKESDRLESLRLESRKLGFEIKIGDDFVEWHGETVEKEEQPLIDPHDDHRVAMSFAMAAFKFGEIRIEHPEVVEKSFIDFWNQLPNAGLQCEEKDGIMVVRSS